MFSLSETPTITQSGNKKHTHTHSNAAIHTLCKQIIRMLCVCVVFSIKTHKYTHTHAQQIDIWEANDDNEWEESRKMVSGRKMQIDQNSIFTDLDSELIILNEWNEIWMKDEEWTWMIDEFQCNNALLCSLDNAIQT